MFFDILSKIRKKYVKGLFVSLILIVINHYVFTKFIQQDWALTFINKLLFIIVGTIIAVVLIYFIIRNIILIIRPSKSKIFKKFGNLDKVKAIIEEMELTKEYEDKNFIISKRYFRGKKDIEDIYSYNEFEIAYGGYRFWHPRGQYRKKIIIGYLINIDKKIKIDNLYYKYKLKEKSIEEVEKIAKLINDKIIEANK